MKREGKRERKHFSGDIWWKQTFGAKHKLGDTLTRGIKATDVTEGTYPTQRDYFDFKFLLRSLFRRRRKEAWLDGLPMG